MPDQVPQGRPMSHTYTSMRIHVIFSTKERQKRIREEFQPKLWAYIAGIARHHGFEAIGVGGAEDHCHALIALPAPMPLSRVVQTLKGCSSNGSMTRVWRERDSPGRKATARSA